MELKEYLAKLAENDEVRPWLVEILAPRPTPPWIGAGVPILCHTLSFEAKGWQTFVCTRLDPCLNEKNLPLARAVLVTFIMVEYQSMWVLRCLPISLCGTSG